MTFAISSPSDVVNVALRRIGYKDRVAWLYDGSKAANVALDIYSQTRDALLRDGDWPFAMRSANGTLLKAAPVGGYIPPTTWSTAYPPPGWLYEYQWPNDCLKVRSVKPLQLFGINFDPKPYLFSVSNDNGYTPPQRVILSNVANPIIVYTGQVTDPTTWPQDFIEDLAAELGRRLAPQLATMDAAKFEVADAQMEDAKASVEQG